MLTLDNLTSFKVFFRPKNVAFLRRFSFAWELQAFSNPGWRSVLILLKERKGLVSSFRPCSSRPISPPSCDDDRQPNNDIPKNVRKSLTPFPVVVSILAFN